MKNKLLPIILCLVLVFTATPMLTGCFAGLNPDIDEEKIDPNRTQLFVGNFNGGMRYEWLKALDNAFEEKYPKYQVIIDNGKEAYQGTQLDNTISSNRQDMYFTTDVDYFQFAAKGHFEDITDVVTKKSEMIDGVATSIEDKMEPALKSYFNKNGKYYAIPFFTAISGFVYDRDLLIDNKVITKNANGEWVGNARYSSQLGPDGMLGTSDDGLPATFEDFKIFLQSLRSKDITPFTWCQNFPYYRVTPLKAIVANYEGYENYLLNYSFNGNHSQLGEITPKNGYKLQDCGGKLAALTFAQEVMSKEENYSKAAFYSSQTHTAAQEEFIQSSLSSNSKPIAMLFEGSWWENEARPAFRALEEDYGAQYGYGKRNFGFLPLPRFEGTAGVPNQTSKKTTLYSDIQSSVFISAYSDQKELAKLFLEFTTSNEALAICTKFTGVVRPYKYNIKDELLNEMTPYAKSMWEIYHSENTQLVTSYNLSEVRRNENVSYFDNWDFGATINGVPTKDPIHAFKLNKGLTVSEYITACKALYNENSWNKQFNIA